MSEQPRTSELSTHAELIVWVVDEWRCELWLVDGTPSLRLFNHGRLASEIRILPHPRHDAWALANRWKRLFGLVSFTPTLFQVNLGRSNS
jgi:hypothetical protein